MAGQRARRAGSAAWWRWLALAAVAALPVGGVLGAAAQEQEPVSIRFGFWGDPAEEAAYQRVVDGFEAGNPGVEVEVDYTPGQSDYYRKLATDFAAGQPPDVFLTNYRQFGQYAARGALAPVGPSLEASEAIEADEYASVSMVAFKFEGEQVCMPQNVSSLVVYYNVDLFEDAGVPLPTEGWSWEEFVEAAEALTQDTDGDGETDQYGVAVEPSMYRAVSFVWSAGGEVVDDLDDPTRLTLDTPEAIAGLEAFFGLGAAEHDVVPPEEEVAAEEDGDRFARGGAAMFLQSRREVPTLREIEGFPWDVAPLPVIEEPATVLHSDAFCVAAASDEREAVWAFVEYAAGEAGQLILAETGRIVPARTSVAESDAFLLGAPAGVATPGLDGGADEPGAGLPPANARVFLDNVPVIRRLPSLSTWPEIEDAFDAEFDRAFYETVDVPAAVARVQAASAELFARAAAEGDDAAP